MSSASRLPEYRRRLEMRPFHKPYRRQRQALDVLRGSVEYACVDAHARRSLPELAKQSIVRSA
jgi:hypothetical protein